MGWGWPFHWGRNASIMHQTSGFGYPPSWVIYRSRVWYRTLRSTLPRTSRSWMYRGGMQEEGASTKRARGRPEDCTEEVGEDEPPIPIASSQTPRYLISSSRTGSLMYTSPQMPRGNGYGEPRIRSRGHSQFPVPRSLTVASSGALPPYT